MFFNILVLLLCTFTVQGIWTCLKNETTRNADVVSTDLCLIETNTARTENGDLIPLTTDPLLTAAAKAHNDLMIAQDCFAHQCAGEDDIGGRVKAQGYKYSLLAENLAAGSPTCDGSIKQWLNSPGHRRNLLSKVKHLGCATGFSEKLKFKHYWTCVYAREFGK